MLKECYLECKGSCWKIALIEYESDASALQQVPASTMTYFYSGLVGHPGMFHEKYTRKRIYWDFSKNFVTVVTDIWDCFQ